MSTNKKIKVFMLSDHIFSPSGVGTQTKYIAEALIKSGKFSVVQFGGAIKHNSYDVVKTEEYGDDLVIYPVDGYGSADKVRSLIRTEKPDIMWFMTDPRFWGWLWSMENEIRPLMPMVYYHVWDNFPAPTFNKSFYESNDLIVTISKVTDDIVKEVTPNVSRQYLSHAVNSEIFKKLPEAQIAKFKKDSFNNAKSGAYDPNKFILFWNNRNARRKQSGTLIYWFADFLDKIGGKDKASLIMHTNPSDENGQDLEAIIHNLGLTNGEVLFSKQKIDPAALAMMYNMADVTINLSDNEGLGLSTMESLSCETPIIVTMTGGLMEQVTDGKNWFGYGIEPASKSIIGSQDVPFIYEDRLNKDDFLDALVKMYLLKKEDRDDLGKAGRKHIEDNYGFENFNASWVKLMEDLYAKHGSWETRRGYKRIKRIDF